MKKLYLSVFCFLFSVSAMAQDVEIPLFDETTPNLGRSAKPLDSLIVTADPLPTIRIPLDSETSAPVKMNILSQSRPDTSRASTKEKADDTPRSIPLNRPQLNAVQTIKMESELQKEIQKNQDSKKETPKATPQPAPAQVQAPTPKQAKPVVTASSLENLFGKTHDVSLFNISGLGLGMTPEEAVEAARENGYAVAKVNHGIPLFRTSFYEHRCREAKIHLPDQIKTCIINQARADEVYYISAIMFQKKTTKESVQVFFSSPATDNISYKVFYENKGDNSLNFTRQNLAKKLRRKEAFWNLMFETYGLPDDSENLIWGEPQKAYMQAVMRGANYDAYIFLEDKDIQDADYFDAEDAAEGLSYSHSFTFSQSQGEN